MAKITVVTYEVIGDFPFPIDMLRYDRATPAREQDSYEISASIDRRLSQHDGPRTVQLRGSNEPTTGRWESFGWKVGNIVVQRY